MSGYFVGMWDSHLPVDRDAFTSADLREPGADAIHLHIQAHSALTYHNSEFTLLIDPSAGMFERESHVGIRRVSHSWLLEVQDSGHGTQRAQRWGVEIIANGYQRPAQRPRPLLPLALGFLPLPSALLILACSFPGAAGPALTAASLDDLQQRLNGAPALCPTCIHPSLIQMLSQDFPGFLVQMNMVILIILEIL